MTREMWLQKIVEHFRPDFVRLKKPLPDLVRVSVGLPMGKRNAVGITFIAEVAKDNRPQVFISPRIEDALEVAHTMVHELIHAAGVRNHGVQFKRLAYPLGLVGEMKASVPGPQLTERLNALIKKLGPYKHAQLDPSMLPKKQTTRMLKAECPEDGYTVRLTRKWVDAMGLPACPCGTEMVVEESDEESE